mmetsp:Transcript_4840/g.4490  ORF Transcript_4840/g.4490 Transcript_4840/m.4490 type:complete len:350 (+) Transcript_4840:479-1528(+)
MESVKRSTTLVEINLASVQATNDGMKEIFSALRGSQNVVSVNVGNIEGKYKNQMAVSGLKELEDLLVHNSFIAVLNLSHIRIGDEGFAVIVRALTSNWESSLVSLNVEHGDISSKSAEAFLELNAKRKVQVLNINSNKIRSQAAIHLCASSFSSLLKLNASSTNIGNEGVKHFFMELRRSVLRELVLDGNEISPKNMVLLKETLRMNKLLLVLGLSSCRISDDTMVTLNEGIFFSTSLQKVNLAQNFIGDQSMRHYKLLFSTKQNNSVLNSLDLSSNQITDEGGVALTQGLCFQFHVQTLNLRNNLVGVKSAQIILECLQNGICKFTHVDLDFNMGISQRLIDEITRAI